MKKINYLLTILLISCSNGNGYRCNQGTPPTESLEPNQTSLMVGCGAMGHGSNTPFISVTICSPGTQICQTIDHIILDTGSIGLKINQSVLNNQLKLPPVLQQITESHISTCAMYGSGYMFGSNNFADISIAKLTAPNMPIEIINDTNQSLAPITCRNAANGKFSDLMTTYGANGIIGINPMIIENNMQLFTYACNGNNCNEIINATGLPISLNINPIASFPEYNNGLSISLPEVPDNSNTNIYGTLTFGLNTTKNNIVPIETKHVQGNPNDYLGSFIESSYGHQVNAIFDSGTNVNAFDSTIQQCSNHSYCPSSPIAWQSTIYSYNNLNESATIFQMIASPYTTNGIASIAPTWGAYFSAGADNAMIYGMPFFYGKTVYIGFNGTIISNMGIGPSWGFNNH